MALWRFITPVAYRAPLEDRPIMSLWTRVKSDTGSTVIQKTDNTWAQFDGAWPQTLDSSVLYFFGPKGFAGLSQAPITSAALGFDSCKRLYLGGHVYIINDALKSELLSAVTQQYPSGYGSFIVSAPVGAQETGDEIMKSGRNSTFDQNTKVVSKQPWGVDK
jgi:hypothetical protein